MIPNDSNLDLTSLVRFELTKKSHINLDVCLGSGQTFSWIRYKEYWLNTLADYLLILSGDDGHVYFFAQNEDEPKIRSILYDYFNLRFDLSDLYNEWSQVDEHFNLASSVAPGVRLLAQTPYESLISFICSQNNGIARITSMVRTLKVDYGRLAGKVNGVAIYKFPDPADLSDKEITAELQAKGFGYRAKYIQAVSQKIMSGELCLNKLAMLPRDAAWMELMKIHGIGPKVADCIALTGLGHMDAVPIDTHIWRVARTKYRGMPTGTSLTLKTYSAIGDRFRQIFGSKAGWAHLVQYHGSIYNRFLGIICHAD